METDCSQSWRMLPDGSYERVACEHENEHINGQMQLFDYFAQEDIVPAAVGPQDEKTESDEMHSEKMPESFLYRWLRKIFG